MVLADRPPTLLTALASRYRLSLFGDDFHDCPQQTEHHCVGLPDLTARHPMLSYARIGIPSIWPQQVPVPLFQVWSDDSFHATTEPLWNEFLTEITAAEAPGRVYFLHLLLPHPPFVFTPDGSRHHSPNRFITGNPADEAAVYANYHQQVQNTDRLVGILLDRLTAAGLYQSSTILLTSDEGPGMVDPSGVDSRSYAVPVFLKSPQLAPGVFAADFSQLDLAPTLLDRLGIPAPAEMVGRSDLPVPR